MSMTQTLIGGGALVLALNFAVQAILPQPTPIVVHGLTYLDGAVIQERTISTDQTAFYAQWAVTVENADTGESLIWCEGNGANAYPPGHRVVQFTLADWTGRTTCTPESLPPGRYALRASWRWGGDGTSAKSEPFEVVE